MTPLTRALSRYLPPFAVGPVLFVIYGFTLLCILIFLDLNPTDIPYLDMGYAK